MAIVSKKIPSVDAFKIGADRNISRSKIFSSTFYYPHDYSIFPNVKTLYTNGYSGFLITNNTYSSTRPYINDSINFVVLANSSNLEKAYAVPQYGQNSFYNCSNLTEISSITSNTTSLAYAFYNCINFTNIPTIPNSVTNMAYSFGYCNKLLEIPTIPNSVTNLAYGFVNCTGLISIPNSKIPDSITNMAGTFFNCSNLTAGAISNNATNLYRTFANTNLRTLPTLNGLTNKNVNVVECFANCFQLSLTGEEILPNIDSLSSMFEYCSKIQKVPKIPECVTNLSYTFFECNITTPANIPFNVTNISDTYGNCTHLTKDIYIESPYIPDASSMVNYFVPNTYTKNIYIPYGNTKTQGAFNNRSSLCNYTLKENPNYVTGNGFYYYKPYKRLVKFVGTSTFNIPTSIVNSSTTYTVEWPEDYKAIKNDLVSNNTDITSADLTNYPYNTIYEDMFYRCKNLTTITNIPSTVTRIDNRAFAMCNFTSFTVPNSITNIGYDAFYLCNNLTNITLFNSITGNLYQAFAYCYGLTTIPIIPNSVTKLQDTFFMCGNLTTATTLPNSITSLSGVFEHCSNLVDVIIPNSVTSLSMTFAYCSNLPTVIIPNSVTDIYYTFQGCSRLTNMSIPDSVVNMQGTFSSCSNLVSVSAIGNNVINMYYTFYSCSNLTGDLYIYSNQITNARNCFTSTTLTKNVYIPFTYENGVNTETYNAFVNAGYDTSGTTNGVYLKDLNAFL